MAEYLSIDPLPMTPSVNTTHPYDGLSSTHLTQKSVNPSRDFLFIRLILKFGSCARQCLAEEQCFWDV